MIEELFSAITCTVIQFNVLHSQMAFVVWPNFYISVFPIPSEEARYPKDRDVFWILGNRTTVAMSIIVCSLVSMYVTASNRQSIIEIMSTK